jgi:hypothetical protein
MKKWDELRRALDDIRPNRPVNKFPSIVKNSYKRDQIFKERILRLDPPIPITTPKGEGLAHFLIDYGVAHNLIWTVFITETGECWSFQNTEIRAIKNITMGRSLKI